MLWLMFRGTVCTALENTLLVLEECFEILRSGCGKRRTGRPQIPFDFVGAANVSKREWYCHVIVVIVLALVLLSREDLENGLAGHVHLHDVTVIPM
jgi:hypothetical protein